MDKREKKVKVNAKDKKRMRKSLKATLLSGVTTFLVLLCAVTVYGMNNCNSMRADTLEQQAQYTAYVDAFGDASSYLTEQVRSYASTGDSAYYDNYWYEVNTAKNRENSIAKMKELGLTAEELAMVDSISAISDGLIPLEEEAMAYVAQGKNTQAVEILYGEAYLNGVTQIKATIEAFNESIQNRVQERLDYLELFINVAGMLTMSAIIAALILQMVQVLFVRRELVDPLKKIRNKMMEFAAGHLSGELDLPNDTTEIGDTARAIMEFQTAQKEVIDDIGVLLGAMSKGHFDADTICEDSYRGEYTKILESLRKINDGLNTTLKDIQIAAEQVDLGGEQVASAAQVLSQGTTEQASSVQELSSIVETVKNDLGSTARQTDEAAELVAKTQNILSISMEEMRKMLAAMGNIEQKSAEIEKIIKVIDDIAFQTNILALNAAVEAARAGAAGKGFAVVADEVRNLAQKSAEAAKNTNILIEETVSAVAAGTKIASETEDAVQDMAASAGQVGEIVVQIKETTRGEYEVMNQIAASIEQISDVVQSNSSTAEESAAASEELSGQAEVLKDLISEFKLRV